MARPQAVAHALVCIAVFIACGPAEPSIIEVANEAAVSADIHCTYAGGSFGARGLGAGDGQSIEITPDSESGLSCRVRIGELSVESEPDVYLTPDLGTKVRLRIDPTGRVTRF